MYQIINVAFIAVLAASLFFAVRFANRRHTGELPQALFPFIAILFTSGMDVGLIMFPLTEFDVYASEAPYQFTNPLAFMFGTWGVLIWAMYFFSTFYFSAIEPKVRIFEIPWVKFINNAVIIGTCSFTGFLFLSFLPDYIGGISDPLRFALVAAVVLCAVYSSTDVRFVKGLSVSSTWVFYALIVGAWFLSGMGLGGVWSGMVELSDYFTKLEKYTSPVSDYHRFYLFWWFAWSIMIGQFVARFVGGLKTWQLLLALLFIPSIPIALWFIVLHFYWSEQLAVGPALNVVMIAVGILFVINSLDSLTRLYTVNLNISVQRFGWWQYMSLNFVLLYGLILAYQFTPFEIEWVGLVVIGLYLTVAVLLTRKKLAGETLLSEE